MSVVYAQSLPELGSQLAMYNFVRQPAVDGQSVAADKQEVRCRASLNLSPLHYGCQRCTLAVAQHCHASARGCSIFFKRAFKIYSIWPQALSYTHRSAQCSPASVGLAQARPD